VAQEDGSEEKLLHPFGDLTGDFCDEIDVTGGVGSISMAMMSIHDGSSWLGLIEAAEGETLSHDEFCKYYDVNDYPLSILGFEPAMRITDYDGNILA